MTEVSRETPALSPAEFRKEMRKLAEEYARLELEKQRLEGNGGIITGISAYGEAVRLDPGYATENYKITKYCPVHTTIPPCPNCGS